MSIVDTRCGSKDCLDRVLEPVKSACGQVEIYQVDAFTDVHFGGNPAGVVPRAEGLPADLMQKIAREMNLSETAFVVDLRKDDFEEKRGLGNQESGAAQTGGTESSICPDFEVRFFTPQSEVDLCGHATIGTFWLLAELGLITRTSPVLDEEIRVYQQTGAGVLPVDLLLGCEGTPSRVMMTQNLPEVAFQLDGPEIAELERILGAPGGAVTGFENARPQAVSTGLLDLIVPVSSRRSPFHEEMWLPLPGFRRNRSQACTAFQWIQWILRLQYIAETLLLLWEYRKKPLQELHPGQQEPTLCLTGLWT